MEIRALDHIVLNVADVDRAIAWYSGLLGLEPERVDEWRDGTVPFPSVRITESCVIDLFAAAPSGENLNHLCLVVDPGVPDDVASDDRFTVVDGPARRWGARGDGYSVYVRDPDGNTVELRSYESSGPHESGVERPQRRVTSDRTIPASSDRSDE